MIETHKKSPEPEDVFDMTNPVPEGVDPKDFWHAVDILDSRYGGKEKYKPGNFKISEINKNETYLEKLVRETRKKLPELLAIVEEGKKQGLIHEYHELAKGMLQKHKDQRRNTDR